MLLIIVLNTDVDVIIAVAGDRSFDYDVTFWARYVDDTFCIIQ